MAPKIATVDRVGREELLEFLLIRVTIERWGPIATGGFPPELAE